MADAKENPEPQVSVQDGLEGLADDLEGMDGPIDLDAAFDFPTDETTALKAERDELKDRLLRALAEAENSRKRGERDRRDAEVYGGTRLARDILTVYDNLNRALEIVDEDLKTQAPGLIEGIELVQKDLIAAFSKHQIRAVNPEFGEKFDPQEHQAMFEAPVPNAPAGTIIQVMNVGFTIGERLLRPAQVGVSSTPAGSVKTAPNDEETE